MLVSTSKQQNTLIVSTQELRLESSISAEFHKYVASQLSDDISVLILDLEPVEFIDSSGLGSIVAIKKSCSADTHIRICTSHPNVLSIFKLTRMDIVFDIYDNCSAAQAA